MTATRCRTLIVAKLITSIQLKRWKFQLGRLAAGAASAIKMLQFVATHRNKPEMRSVMRSKTPLKLVQKEKQRAH